jgi:hypothetical protein
MRKTKFAFFIILLFLTAVLVVIIVGESNRFAVDSEVLTMAPGDRIDLLTDYQRSVEDILLSWQQQILQQSVTRDEAIRQIREDLLGLEGVPLSWRDLHLNLILALTKDMNGQWAEAQQRYEELEASYQWLRASLEYLSSIK